MGPDGSDERPRLDHSRGSSCSCLSNMQFFKVAGADPAYAGDLHSARLASKSQVPERAERINHIALLTNAQEIPGRDPAHVGDLLKIDAAATGNENAVDHLIRTQEFVDAPIANDQEAAEPQWWERLPG